MRVVAEDVEKRGQRPETVRKYTQQRFGVGFSCGDEAEGSLGLERGPLSLRQIQDRGAEAESSFRICGV